MMKTKMFLAFLIGMITLSSCNENDLSYNPTVPEKAQQELLARYPQAKDVHWDVVKSYHVARFNATKGRATAATYNTNVWFTSQGQFCQTDEDIEFKNLPHVVQVSFNKYKEKMMYQEWEIDDCEVLTREGMASIYIIEIENDDWEREISISESGDILKDILDDDDEDEVLPVIIPKEIYKALQTIFPDTYTDLSILELEIDDDEIEIDVIEDGHHKEIELNAKYELISIEYEVSLEEARSMIDEKVFQALVELAHKSGIDLFDASIQEAMEIEVKYTVGKGLSFEIEIDINDMEFEIEIDEEGNTKIK